MEQKIEISRKSSARRTDMKMTVLVLCLMLLAASSALAADVSGVWTGTLTPDGRDNGDTALLILRQDGDKLTGTGGPNQSEQRPIANGAIKGDRITFEVQAAESRVISFDLKVAGDQLTGRAEMRQDGQVRGAATINLKRESANAKE
jgi:hypothetical protein